MNLFLKKVIQKSTLYYTLIVTFFSIIVLITNSSEDTISIDPSRTLLFFPFCVCFALANTLLQYKNIEAVTRWLVHFVLTVLSAFIFIILPADLNSGSGNFMGLVFILVIYFIGLLFSAILSSRIKKSIKLDNELKTQKHNTLK